jgi:hypothetical protein
MPARSTHRVVYRCRSCSMIDAVDLTPDEHAPQLPVIFCSHCEDAVASLEIEPYTGEVVDCAACSGGEDATIGWCSACAGTGIEQPDPAPALTCAEPECERAAEYRRRHDSALCDRHAREADEIVRRGAARLRTTGWLLRAQDV